MVGKKKSDKIFYGVAVVISVLIIVISLVATFLNSFRGEYLIKYNNKYYTQEDMLIDIYLIEQDLYRVVMTYEQSLNTTLDSNKINNMMKDVLIDKFVGREWLYNKATNQQKKLSEQDKNEINKKANDLLIEIKPNEKLNQKIDEKYAIEFYTKELVANRVQNTMMNEDAFDFEAEAKKININDYKQWDIEMLQVPLKTFDNKNNAKDIDEKQKNKLYNQLKNIHKKIKQNNSLEKYETDGIFYREMQVLSGDEKYSKDLKDRLAKMDINEYSEVFRYKDLYCIVKMIDNTSKVEYKKVCDEAIDNSKTKYFEQKFKNEKSKMQLSDSWQSLFLNKITIN